MTKPRRDFHTRFKPLVGVELAEKVVGVRLPVAIDKLVREKLDPKTRGDWLRQVITEAALRDLTEE